MDDAGPRTPLYQGPKRRTPQVLKSKALGHARHTLVTPLQATAHPDYSRQQQPARRGILFLPTVPRPCGKPASAPEAVWQTEDGSQGIRSLRSC